MLAARQHGQAPGWPVALAVPCHSAALPFQGISSTRQMAFPDLAVSGPRCPRRRLPASQVLTIVELRCPRGASLSPPLSLRLPNTGSSEPSVSYPVSSSRDVSNEAQLQTKMSMVGRWEEQVEPPCCGSACVGRSPVLPPGTEL